MRNEGNRLLKRAVISFISHISLVRAVPGSWFSVLALLKLPQQGHQAGFALVSFE
jgi:hypothetical protein